MPYSAVYSFQFQFNMNKVNYIKLREFFNNFEYLIYYYKVFF